SRLGLACAGTQWLIRLADAGEVIALPSVATVPLTQPWYLGIANIRGNLYSVIDFAGFLGSPASAAPSVSGQSRLVLFGPRVGEGRGPARRSYHAGKDVERQRLRPFGLGVDHGSASHRIDRLENAVATVAYRSSADRQTVSGARHLAGCLPHCRGGNDIRQQP